MKAAHSIKRKKLGFFPYFSVIVSISISIFIIGLLGIIYMHSQKLMHIIHEKVEMHIYLKKRISNSALSQVRHTLEHASFVSKNSDKTPRIHFISKQEAAQDLINATGEDFVEFLGENPLRDAFTININKYYQTEAKMKQIKKNIVKLPGVFEVDYIADLTNKINENIKKVSLILASFSLLLVLVVVILINNTIKLALFSQRFLIRSMQLVGATNGFIRRPFLYRAIRHAIIASLLACAALYALNKYALTKIEYLVLLENTEYLYFLFGILLLLGIILGFFSTLKAINKYLKLSLDELY